MAQREALVALTARDLLSAFKVNRCWGPWPFLARFPAHRFADEILAFDVTVSKEGLVAGGRFVLNRFAGSVRAVGVEQVPHEGPLIVTANHPGMVDAMAVWVAMGREDTKMIAAERDILRLLPGIRHHLIFIEEGSSRAFREAADHLRSGGAILTFPAGRIEPDMAGAQSSSNNHRSGVCLRGDLRASGGEPDPSIPEGSERAGLGCRDAADPGSGIPSGGCSGGVRDPGRLLRGHYSADARPHPPTG